MGKPWLVVTAAAVAATTGCEARVRECGGGVEVVIALADVDALAVAAGTLRVTLDLDGVIYERGFEASSLGGGTTSFTLDLDNPAPASLVVTVEVPYAGPGVFSGEVAWLRGEGAVVVPVGAAGCLELRVEMTTAPDRDGDRVPDTIDLCIDDPDPAQADGDADLIGDACDGCVAAANPTQVDGDGDLVQDACDACPAIANHAPADEDDDLIPDVCDPCPHLAGDRADGDGDQVGDACDPRPTTGGDRIVAFLGFDDPAQLTQLTRLGTGVVSIDSGQLVIFTDTNAAAVLARTLSTSGTIATRVHQSNVTTEYPWGAGVIAWADPTRTADLDANGTLCLSRQARAVAMPWPSIGTPVQPTVHDPDAVVRFGFFDEGSTDPIVALAQCTAAASSVPYTAQWSGTPVYAGFGLIAIDSVARFDYLVVIDSP